MFVLSLLALLPVLESYPSRWSIKQTTLMDVAGLPATALGTRCTLSSGFDDLTPETSPPVVQRSTATMAPEPGSTERHQASRPAHPSPSDLAVDSCRPGVN